MFQCLVWQTWRQADENSQGCDCPALFWISGRICHCECISIHPIHPLIKLLFTNTDNFGFQRCFELSDVVYGEGDCECGAHVGQFNNVFIIQILFSSQIFVFNNVFISYSQMLWTGKVIVNAGHMSAYYGDQSIQHLLSPPTFMRWYLYLSFFCLYLSPQTNHQNAQKKPIKTLWLKDAERGWKSGARPLSWKSRWKLSTREKFWHQRI